MNALLVLAVLAQPLPAPRVVPGTVVLGAPIVSESIIHPDGREELLWSSNPSFTARMKAQQAQAPRSAFVPSAPSYYAQPVEAPAYGVPSYGVPSYSVPSYYSRPPSYSVPAYSVPRYSGYSGYSGYYPSTYGAYGTYSGGYCPPGQV